MRQAFREEFILHRTETEESDYPRASHSMLAGGQPGGEGASRPASRDKAEATATGAQQGCLALATFSAPTAPTPLSHCNSWSRSTLFLPVSALTLELGIKW